jgi:simple sugar transport system permease protein
MVIAMAIGLLVGLLHALFCVHLRADQIVVGTAVNILALGLTAFLFRKIYGFEGSPPDISRVPDVSIPGVRDIPFVGRVIGDLNLMIWLAIGLTILAWFVLWRTPLGLRIRAVGEHPRAAETVGIDVYRIRYLSVALSGMLAALGGAYLSIGFVGSFSENMSAGQGFIALAVMILGKWRPFPILASAMLFGLSAALADRLGGVGISPDLIKGLPYAVTLIALVGFIGRATPPAADGKVYARGGH